MRPMSYLAGGEYTKLSTTQCKKTKDAGLLQWEHLFFHLHPDGVAADVTVVHIKGNTPPKIALPEQTRTLHYG
jgi:hypothetical protein